MARLPQFAILYDGDISKVEKLVAEGILSFPAYIYNDQNNHLLFLKKDGVIEEVEGNNKKQVVNIESLPSPAEGDVETLYVCGGVVYYFDSEDKAYYPTYKSLQEKIVVKQQSGTIVNPVIINELGDGVYGVSGEYKISSQHPTLYSTSGTVMFIVEGNDIQKVCAKEIIQYHIDNDEITTDKVVMESTLNGYIDQYIEQKLIQTLPETVAEVINEVLIPASDEDIENLFE